MSTWTHELPMRWADLDLLNHVTNAVYLDYALEAQHVLRHEGVTGLDASVRELTITYQRPTRLSATPLVLHSALDGDVLTQEIRVRDDSGEEHLHARVVTSFGDPEPPPVPELDDEPLPVRVRSSDVDGDGVITSSGLLQVAQDARILHFSQRMDRAGLGAFVVGTLTVHPGRPLTWRPEPYDTHSWVERVGRGSFTLLTALGDPSSPAAVVSTVLVGFDADQQVARPFDDTERDELLAHVR